MSLSLPKLRLLWKLQQKTPHWLSERCAEIERIAQRWDNSELPEFSQPNTAEEEDIPTGNWATVSHKLSTYYQKHTALQSLTGQIQDVSDLFQIDHRHPLLRIASDNKGETDDESDSTTCTQRKPESFFASYNFPFEIIRFYQSCKDEPAADQLSFHKPHRFISKFVWMVSNREQHLPILSLESLWGLSHLLRQVALKVGYEKVRYDLATISFHEFITVWPKISEAFVQQVTGYSYQTLGSEQKRQLWRMLLAASVEQTTTKNAMDMLKTGNKALILYGPPGTGKTYHAKKIAEQMLFPDGGSEGELQSCQLKASGTPDAVEHGCWEIIQFHPSFSYQDFIGGILPILDEDSGNLCYTLNNGIFMRFCKAAESHSEKPFVLIIDEINRADLSSVFGELMYALEYRGEKVSVPHFKESFVIPPNVHLIGTMNTADKSLVSFDLALRRRFTFMNLAPDLDCLLNWGVEKEQGFLEGAMVSLVSRAKSLNAWLTDSGQGLGRPVDLAIGQAYFMKVKGFCPEDKEGGGRILTSFALEQLWDYHLEPLIEEYLGAEVETFRTNLTKKKEEFITDLPDVA